MPFLPGSYQVNRGCSRVFGASQYGSLGIFLWFIGKLITVENDAVPSIFLWFDLSISRRSFFLFFLFCFNDHKDVSAEPAMLASVWSISRIGTCTYSISLQAQALLQLGCVFLDVMSRQYAKQEHPSVISDSPREECAIKSHVYASSWGFWRITEHRLVGQGAMWWWNYAQHVNNKGNEKGYSVISFQEFNIKGFSPKYGH